MDLWSSGEIFFLGRALMLKYTSTSPRCTNSANAKESTEQSIFDWCGTVFLCKIPNVFEVGDNYRLVKKGFRGKVKALNWHYEYSYSIATYYLHFLVQVLSIKSGKRPSRMHDVFMSV